MKSFILMLQFLTKLPINIEINADEEILRKGMVYFPLTGLVIGILNAAVYMLFSTILSSTLSAIIVTLFNVCLTGAFHLDGLADTCDGIYSSRNRERMLEIMKDSRIGTNGAAAIFFDLTLRIALLSSMKGPDTVKAILAASILSRTILVFLSYISVYARKENGLGNLFIGKITMKSNSIALSMATALSLLILGWKALIITASVILIMTLYQKYIKSKIGGMTGDTLGAAAELTEVLVLFIFVVSQRFGLL